MTRAYSALLAGSAMLALGGCVASTPEQPQASTVIVAPTPPQVATVVPTSVVAPMPPPPPESELVPTPPQGAGPAVWQPGHWAYTGVASNPWSWVSGVYVTPPSVGTTWIPGQWQQMADGSWMWVAGHWA